jgi:flotillin
VVFVFLLLVLSRYKRCPSDQILVVYGKVGKGSARCIHGGAAFIIPVFQAYDYISLRPIQIEVPLTGALSKQNIRVDVPSNFTVGVSTRPEIMTAAAERLLGLAGKDIETIAKEIIFGQLRLCVATMDIEDINSDRDKFLANISKNVETELEKIGLCLINVNVTDIRDESGYISALGKKAAAEAINMAKKDVAERDRDGAIGQARAQQDQRVQVADANAKAVEGENTAKVVVANSDASRREREAEATRRAVAAEKVQSAKALQESYLAEKEAEAARANRERATQEADIIVNAEIQKRKIEIDAEAVAERTRREAKGEADGVFFRMDAQARGTQEILSKQAEGFGRIVQAAANDPSKAALMMIVDKLPEIVRTQVEAIKNIKIDKITVWDNGVGKDGKTSTAGFLSGLIGSVPPLQELFKMSGMELPEYLGKSKHGSADGEFTQASSVGASSAAETIPPMAQVEGTPEKTIAVCPGCGKRYNVTAILGDPKFDQMPDVPGQQLKCKECGKFFTLPDTTKE